MTGVDTMLVGLDVGTSGIKAVVYRVDGTPVATGRARTPWRVLDLTSGADTPGTELDANELLAAARTALAQALSTAPAGHIAAVGVTSMAESGVLLDRGGRPAAPVVAWHDTRDAAQMVRLGSDIGADAFSARTGLPFRSQWSLTKHLWQVENHPEASRAVRRLNIAEWIVRGLGGEEASDVSLASRTGWLDLALRAWWTESLAWSNLTESMLPPVVSPGTPLGRVASNHGLERLTGAVLTTAGQDHQAAALGAGAATLGDQLDSCGSAEALVRTIPAGLPEDRLVQLARAGITVGWHVVDGHWVLLGATQGGLALERLAALLGGNVQTALEAGAAQAASGRITVHVSPAAEITIAGVREGTEPGEVWLAALDAITEQIRAVGLVMSEVAGSHRSTVVVGGWARSEVLLRLKRAAFGDARRSTVVEAGAWGSALLAGTAAGLWPEPQLSMVQPTQGGRST